MLRKHIIRGNKETELRNQESRAKIRHMYGGLLIPQFFQVLILDFLTLDSKVSIPIFD